MSKKKNRIETACEAKNIDFFLPSDTNFCEKRGTKALVNAPSAKRLRNRLGNLNETKKASEAIPAPKKLAKTISLTNPVMRLMSVNPPKVAIDLNNDIFIPFFVSFSFNLHKKTSFAKCKKNFYTIKKKT